MAPWAGEEIIGNRAEPIKRGSRGLDVASDGPGTAGYGNPILTIRAAVYLYY
jgi:hypothetical protein